MSETNTLAWDVVKAINEFTYYPIMSPEDCWFRVETMPGADTYHQCHLSGRNKVGVYGFCDKHAKVVAKAVEDITNQQLTKFNHPPS